MAEERRRFQPLRLYRGAFEWTIYTEDGSEVAFEVYDEAYAHLFAAAPELYRDLSDLVEYMRKVLTKYLGYSESEADEDLAPYTRSLRKARGEEVTAE